MQLFIAVKLDIVGSRHITRRARVQEQLLNAVEKVNVSFGGSIRSDFIVTHGDEVQGLLDAGNVNDLWFIVEHFIDRLQPIKLRFGVGFGTLSTRLQPKAIGMDGKVWHLAKQAIQEASKTHTFIQIAGFGSDYDNMINAVANLLVFLRMGWTAEQRAAIALLKVHQKQATVARELGISEAAVSKRLRSAGWQFYHDAQKVLRSLLIESVQEYYHEDIDSNREDPR